MTLTRCLTPRNLTIIPPACETQLEPATEDNSDAEGDADGEDEELDEEDLF